MAPGASGAHASRRVPERVALLAVAALLSVLWLLVPLGPAGAQDTTVPGEVPGPTSPPTLPPPTTAAPPPTTSAPVTDPVVTPDPTPSTPTPAPTTGGATTRTTIRRTTATTARRATTPGGPVEVVPEPEVTEPPTDPTTEAPSTTEAPRGTLPASLDAPARARVPLAARTTTTGVVGEPASSTAGPDVLTLVLMALVAAGTAAAVWAAVRTSRGGDDDEGPLPEGPEVVPESRFLPSSDGDGASEAVDGADVGAGQRSAMRT